MSRFIFVAFACMVLFSLAAACPPNETYEECGTACPPTCENPDPQICTLQCVRGCFCREGLVRASNGQCIPPEECGCDN